ncbi:MAG: asparagine synthase (glutamine-hydrolyzing) [Candidatus Binatia bacterium]
MCGIAGWVGTLPNGDHYARRLARALHHRGPDAYGIQAWPEATLVHTRLSIIDLSPSGAQPMANEDGTVWTIFNGEIYNHHELRQSLKARGHIFTGHADTEVIPHLYEEEGARCITKLRGMFALAIYDTRSRTLVLARDRFGIKPLFYAPGSERFSFASELRALLELPGIDIRPDRQAIYDFSALFHIPAPETFYSGIRALQPGELLEVQLDRDRVAWKTQTYHHWSIAPNPDLTLGQAAAQAEALLMTAVQRQMESDVPLGALLSGGIDSSLVSEAAQSALGGQLRTFNVRFAEKAYDETWAAVAVANHIGSQHQILEMSNTGGTWNQITDLLLHAGQPFADTSIFAMNAVCRLMRDHVTVALSGDGGDEGFGGYVDYWRIARISQWQTVPAPMWYAASFALGFLAPLRLVSDHIPQRLNELARADDTSIIQSLYSWIREEEQQRLCHDTTLLPIRRLFEPQWEYVLPAQSSRVERLAAHTTEVNIRLTLPNDFLFKVDTASMRESLEIRVPMLDEDLLAFALSLPYSLKVNGRTCKLLLRTIAAQKLPRAVVSKPKCGFGIPVDTWVDHDFKVRLRETLLGPASSLPEFFRPEAYRPLVEAFCEGRPCRGISREGLYQRAIMLLSVHLALANS